MSQALVATYLCITTLNSAVAGVPFKDTRFGQGTDFATGSDLSSRRCIVGEIMLTISPQANGIPADGRLMQIQDHPVLFEKLGTFYGGDGIATFALPDLREAAPNGTEYTVCTFGHLLLGRLDAGKPYSVPRNPFYDARFGVQTNRADTDTRPDACIIGEIMLFAGNAAAGTRADGQLLPISDNRLLFRLFGVRYGGNGITKFALPDLRRAAPNGTTYTVCTRGLLRSLVSTPKKNWARGRRKG